MKKDSNLLAMGLILGLLAAVQAGCAGSAKVKETTAQPAAQTAPAQQAPAAQPAAESAPAIPVLSGKVVETMDASGYTYICLDKDGKKIWSAVPKTAVKVGDVVEILPGMVMSNFTSKALNRSFERIIFSDGLAPKK
jgi:hypothetical protein